VQTEEEVSVKVEHPAELLREELKMGLDHPSYRFGKKKKQNQGE
jgi:hypothetical protein